MRCIFWVFFGEAKEIKKMQMEENSLLDDVGHHDGELYMMVKEGKELMSKEELESLRKFIDYEHDEFVSLVVKRDFWSAKKRLNLYPLFYFLNSKK